MNEKLERITFSAAQGALLEQLADYWGHIAKTAHRDAAHCAKQEDKHQLQRKAMHFLNCAEHLRLAVATGDLPAHLGFQVRASS